MRKIVIAGGSGFLGKALVAYFRDKGIETIVLSRKPEASQIYWDGKSIGDWVDVLEGSDALINLSGKSVDCRYNQSNRDKILSSRIESTKVLNIAMSQCKNPPKVWLNSSSATIYIHSENEIMTEQNGIIGDDFSMNICKRWESEFFNKSIGQVRKVALRTSIVLGENGGAFPKMKWLSQLGMGGKQGNGKQYMSWIHIKDFCKAVDFIIQNENMEGEINITSPEPVKNDLFTEGLRRSLNMPIGFSQSRFLLELGSVIIGTETELLLKSRKVYPEKLIENGFVFDYGLLAKAFENLCH
ncbi:TIGR01777 family oxidoreductase [Chondrinema litorale]|uniref:TIGR01777 family oxidoreductase n=1 Tax=Chondrinema litorale TaxID=2994555 RepID=UPI0025444B5F|nr:TIGR01777 family oxidoreductase [Chondrinema litorale]UZR94852.1 TIGR01777 family oxidoreductase [Chondrinema litorale]